MNDVCLILEGTYPYVAGGVSVCVYDLIRNLPHLNFSIIHLAASGDSVKELKYPIPNNIKEFHEIFLFDFNFSDEMIKNFQNNLPKARAFRMPMTEMHWENEFDAIVSSYSLLCLPLEEFSLMANKINKALKKGGYFLLFLNEGDSKEGKIQEVQGHQLYSTGVSEQEIRDIFEPKGMKVIRLEREKCESKEYGIEHEMMFLMKKI